MPVSQELLDILVCPETKQPVSPASHEVLAKLADDIRAGRWWWENPETRECGLHEIGEEQGSGI